MRLLIGSIVLLLKLPNVGLQCVNALYHQKKIALYTRNYVGKDLEPITHRTLMIANAPLGDIDTWLLYLKGKLNIIGPKPLTLDATNKLTRDERMRFTVAPGIISPHQVKSASGIAHQDENKIEMEFIQNSSRLRRSQIFIVWLVQQVLWTSPRNLVSPSHFQLMGVRVANISMQRAVQLIVDSLERTAQFQAAEKFAFVNADCVNHYYKDSNYKRILNEFDTVFADGIGVKIAARWHGVALTENVNGTDMLPYLCEQLAAKGKSIYLLGATPSVIAKVASKLTLEYPSLKVAGYYDGYRHSDNPTELYSLINSSGADLLLVAMGTPRQERWIEDHIAQINVKAVIGVGGLFDFYSEEVSRAPIWLRELSLEWVWRLAIQPLDKGKRYLLGNPLFLLRAMRATRINPNTRGVRHDAV